MTTIRDYESSVALSGEVSAGADNAYIAIATVRNHHPKGAETWAVHPGYTSGAFVITTLPVSRSQVLDLRERLAYGHSQSASLSCLTLPRALLGLLMSLMQVYQADSMPD